MTPASPPPMVAQQQQQSGPMARPIGVTIVAVIQILGGVALALVALFFFLSSAFIKTFGGNFAPWITKIIEAGAVFIGVFFLILGALAIAVAVGNLKGAGWAWGMTVVLTGLALLFNLIGVVSGGGRGLGANIVEILVQGLVIWYYFTAPVKAFFHRPMGQQQQAAVVR